MASVGQTPCQAPCWGGSPVQESVHRVSPAAQVPLADPFSDGTSQYVELEAWVLHKRVAKKQVGRGIAAVFTDGPMACLLQWGFFKFFL